MDTQRPGKDMQQSPTNLTPALSQPAQHPSSSSTEVHLELQAAASVGDVGSDALLQCGPHHPFNWDRRMKWVVTLTTCFVCFAVGINATAIAGAVTPINEHYRVSDKDFPNSFWPVASWTVGAALVPMVALPVMEEHGVRLGYLISHGLFFLLLVPQALSPTFSGIIVSRFFAGGCAGILQNGMDGIIADIWPGAAQRSLPVTIYVTGLLAGISFGPVFGALIAHHRPWRWIVYAQFVLYGVTLLIVIAVMKETRGPVIARKEAKKARDTTEEKAARRLPYVSSRSIRTFLYDTVILPAFLLCTEPVVFFFTLLSAVSYGVVFISTQSVPQVFATNYAFTELQTGLVQISIVIGELLGFGVCLLQNAWYDAVAKAKSEMSEQQVAEARLYTSIPASFLALAGGLFFYAWTSSAQLPWILPALGLAMVGLGVTVVMQAIMMYVTDAYARYAASASAAVCFGENMFAAFLPLAAFAMYTNLGFQWASSVLAFIALIASFAPIVLVWKGESIRVRSPFIQKAMYKT